MLLPLDLPARPGLPAIPGLSYVQDFVSGEEAGRLLEAVDREPWLCELRRRVQHYGYRYDYKARSVRRDACLGPLPAWLHDIATKVAGDTGLNALPDQVIVNEYEPGQGISRHIDCVPCFGPRIAILSLGSDCVMQFTHPATAAIQDAVLEERSLLVLSGPARFAWQHAIPARKSDVVGGVRISRTRRVSITFRTVVLTEAAGYSGFPSGLNSS